MSSFRIFTESKADIKFLKDYIEEIIDIDINEEDFDTLGSWSGYKIGGSLKASMRQNFDEQKKTVLIIDADNDFEARIIEITRDFQSYNVPILLYLFPNNSSSGNLESLLCEIAVERKIITCFENYEICINGYETPVIKSKVFAYLDALLPAKNKKNDSIDLIQEKNRNYKNKDHWNLRHDYLNSLRDFFQNIVS
ncbi:MAG: hypothetical protein QM764_04720 [Chitinophagaceae bacterium]